jgi:serine/threonine protein kinase
MQYIEGEGLDRIWNRLRNTWVGKSTDPNAALADQSVEQQIPAPPECESLTFSRSGSNAGYHRRVAQTGQQVAAALAFAHSKKILHRDVKTSNLLLDRQGDVWIADFGLASAFEGDDGLTETGDLMGTLRFMAPERFAGISDERGDVYALGVTLYELLTLERLFPDSDRARLVERILHTQPNPPRRVDPRVPRDPNTIVLKAIEKDPGGRYQNAAAVAEDLSRFLAGEPLKDRRTPVARRAWMWCKRNPWIATAAGTFMAAILTVAIVSTVFSVKPRSSLSESDRRLAQLNFVEGYTALGRGESGVGMLRMADCYQLAVAAGDAAWADTAEGNLAAWQSEFPPVKAIFSHSSPISSVASSPDGK